MSHVSTPVWLRVASGLLFVAGLLAAWTLGMGALGVGLAGFGYQIAEAFQDPKPRTLVNASLFVMVPRTLALVINRVLRARSAG